jgi:hypothetical protein
MLSTMSDDLYKVTIVRSRYGGTYEPGVWVAFPYWPEDLSPDWNAGDVACAGFFADRGEEIGGGDTPQEAYDDLCRRLDARRARLRRD